ncbi:rCG36955 [Rattus norvegicus]|uniref:RCG36955 n=1 Tax=Rattus norvegicus TaxID=10116 RepID=A6HTP3_RAT|nr:rCG36955 [Rattus norvegicus]
MPRPCRTPGPRRSLQHHSVLHLPEDRAASQQQQRHCGQCTDPAHSK